MRVLDSDGVRALMRQACNEAGTQKAWAEKIGVSPGFVSDILKGGREPSGAVLRAPGLERAVMYRRARSAGIEVIETGRGE
jgi:DNA-binding transcriptional regulator YdaS (Cro superfamily)